jgi:predicted anti-sigma-YlaC factor YlaD
MSPMPGNMSCRELVELVTDYLDGALSQADVVRLETHIQACGPCAEYIEQVRTAARLAAVAELELRPDREALLTAFRGFRRTAES